MIYSGIQTLLILLSRNVNISYLVNMTVQIFSIVLSARYIDLAKYMIGNWAMYTRSTLACQQGFEVYSIIIIEVIILVAIIFLGDKLIQFNRKRK